MLFQLSRTDRYFEFESAPWFDPSGVDERTKPWFWAKGCVLRSQALQQLVKCWFSFNFDSNVCHSNFLFFRSECKGWQICYNDSSQLCKICLNVQLCSESLIKLLCPASINCETEDCNPGNGVWRETRLCNYAFDISASYQDSYFITNFWVARNMKRILVLHVGYD